MERPGVARFALIMQLARMRCCVVALLLLCASASFGANPLRIVELSAEELARLNRSRVLIQRYLPDPDSRSKYQTVPGKLGTIRAIMRVDPVTPARRDLMEALGVVMGDTFVQDMGFHWAAIETASGRQIVIRYKRSNIFLYPLTMVAERVQRGERVDALELYNDVAADVEERIDDEP
jgi:hypothetical protein